MGWNTLFYNIRGGFASSVLGCGRSPRWIIKEVSLMPNIQSSTSLRNNYNDISTFCRENREPVFITRNGQGDLAVMSIELYEALNGKLELYRLLDEGRAAANAGQLRPYEDVFQEIEQEIIDGRL